MLHSCTICYVLWTRLLSFFSYFVALLNFDLLSLLLKLSGYAFPSSSSVWYNISPIITFFKFQFLLFFSDPRHCRLFFSPFCFSFPSKACLFLHGFFFFFFTPLSCFVVNTKKSITLTRHFTTFHFVSTNRLLAVSMLLRQPTAAPPAPPRQLRPSFERTFLYSFFLLFFLIRGPFTCCYNMGCCISAMNKKKMNTIHNVALFLLSFCRLLYWHHLLLVCLYLILFDCFLLAHISCRKILNRTFILMVVLNVITLSSKLDWQCHFLRQAREML